MSINSNYPAKPTGKSLWVSQLDTGHPQLNQSFSYTEWSNSIANIDLVSRCLQTSIVTLMELGFVAWGWFQNIYSSATLNKQLLDLTSRLRSARMVWQFRSLFVGPRVWYCHSYIDLTIADLNQCYCDNIYYLDTAL